MSMAPASGTPEQSEKFMVVRQADPNDVDVASDAGSGTANFTLRDFLIAAFYHYRIILLAAALPALVGIVGALSARTEYTASSLLMVIVSREVSTAQNVTDSGPSVLSIEGLKQVEAEVQILQSAEVARAVVEQIGIDRLFPKGRLATLLGLGGSDDDLDRAIERLQGSMRAAVQANSNVIKVSYTNADRALAVETTNAIVHSYLAVRRRTLENPTSKILVQEVQRFSNDLSTVDKQIESLKSKAGIIDFAQDAVLAANQVDSIIQRQRQVGEREVAVTAQLTEAEKQLAALPNSVFEFAENTNAVPGDEDPNTLTKLLMERDRIAAQYAPGSVLLRELDKQIATVRAKIKVREDRRYVTDRASRNPQINYVQTMVLSLRVEKDSLSRQQVELVEQLKVARERLATLRAVETPLIELNRRRDALNDGFREYQRRAVAASIEETAAQSRQSSVRVVQDAGAAVVKRSLTFPILAGGLFAGLLFGAAAGALASAMRTTMVTPHEVENRLGVPVVAVFDMDPDEIEIDLSERAIGTCATVLLDARVDGEPVRVFHVLSPDFDDSLPKFSRDLAEEFARQRGRRTLLIDLTTPPPPIPSMRDVEVRGGVAMIGTPVPNLWMFTDVQPSPLLDLRIPISDALRMTMELKTSFDHVLIASNPTVASLLSQRFCQVADGNLVAIQAEKTRTPAASHLVGQVTECGGLLLGAVLFGRRYYLPDWLYHRT
ncbi:lipopolysaccharide biosynthesis protein [Xanthobacter sp. 126]|uniref:exopolysaccharide transport family protein n=1 Tax=Xanthobacter sp. 126 TaxID=1131814 RepID=UPI001FD8980F|nr:lipopolysaccharide biosynthesis protein [Xanthobacter sp. 126]